jgi:hypothetical protein
VWFFSAQLVLIVLKKLLSVYVNILFCLRLSSINKNIAVIFPLKFVYCCVIKEPKVAKGIHRTLEGVMVSHWEP